MGNGKTYLVVSFHTTSDAMAMRQAGAAWQLSGRLIPIPRQLSAGCGLAWSEPAENRESLMRTIKIEGIDYEQIAIMDK